MNIDCEIIEKEGFFAILNPINNTQTKFEFSEIKPLSEDYFSCCRDKEYFILDSNGNFRSRSAQQHFEWFNFDRILTKRDHKFGFIDFNDRVTITFKYDEIIYKERYFDVRINNMWGTMNVLGRELTHIKYTEAIVYTEKEIAFVTDSLSGRKGLINKSGIEIIPTIYTYIIQDVNNSELLYISIEGCDNEYSRNFFSGHISNAKWGCYDITGKLIIPISYDCIKTEGDYLYAGWAGTFLQEGQWLNFEDLTEYSGVYDLYNKQGHFLIGGFDLFKVELGVLFFHFGGNWKTKCGEYKYHTYSFEAWNGKWVVTDANLDSLIYINGNTYNIAQNGKRIMPKSIKVEKQIASTKYKASRTEISIEIQIPLPKEILFHNPNGVLMPNLIDENVILIGYSGSIKAIFVHEKITTEYFNEIEVIDKSMIFIKRDGLCGIMKYNEEFIEIKYFAITNPIFGYIITAQETESKNYKCELLNINDLTTEPIVVYDELTLEELGGRFRYQSLRLQVLNKNDNLLLSDIGFGGFEDETLNLEFRKMICQKRIDFERKLQRYWFPRMEMNFITYDSSDDFDEPNYKENTWDAMTDGMYGDYPGAEVDYD